MVPIRLRRLVTLPGRAVVALLASVATGLAVWHGGLSVLTVLGVPQPTRGDTGTALRVLAVAVASSAVPGWLTLRTYVGPDLDAGDEVATGGTGTE